MNVCIREESQNDYNYVDAVIRASFWNVYKPGCDEHLMASKLRKSDDYIPELDLIAEVDKKIVGFVMGTKANIVNNNKQDKQSVVAVGPICVLPEWQGKGIGTQLMHSLIEKAKLYGAKGLVLYGNPTYYSKFGFVNAKKYMVTMPDGNNIEDFMLLELEQNSMKDVCGKCFESSAFEVNKEELILFEKKFIGKDIPLKKQLPQLDYERIKKEFLAQGAELTLSKSECTGLSDQEKM